AISSATRCFSTGLSIRFQQVTPGLSPVEEPEASVILGFMARVLLLDNGTPHDIFEVVEVSQGLIRARSPFLFEIGEELELRIEDGDKVTDATARVRAHVG